MAKNEVVTYQHQVHKDSWHVVSQKRLYGVVPGEDLKRLTLSQMAELRFHGNRRKNVPLVLASGEQRMPWWANIHMH